MMKSLIVASLLAFASIPSFADEDMPKGAGPCRAKVEELQTTRQKLKECLHAWIQAAKTGGENPGDDCGDHVEAFVSKAKEIKACRLEHKEQK